ncbi:type III secretion system chaperone [Pectobacteriaceae bacterium CE70]|nr:type III secretion system chaperone [Pectobacteriaceae bacterium C52]WJV69027.1 type III secretion system chaperone [Pectobacteriaceae bacterium CE70]WJY12965.1 type III secretion system chaperone [Pectobacteriaceae bacterium C80]
MTSAQQRAAHLLHYFGRSCRTEITLNEGICVLLGDDGQEAAVIEVPEHSDSLLVHCQILDLQGEENPVVYKLMLQLNFEMAAMRGCWLALDEYYNLRLCAQHSLATLDEARFSAILSGFIQQVKETQSFIASLLEKTRAA